MSNPKLVVMAAGLGSRYGGLKQIEPITDQNEIILDFACYDAWKAGFKDIIFIIKPSMEEVFKEKIICNMSKYVNCSYVFQDIVQLPDGYTVPEGREKPWGTCHAVMAAKELLKDVPFAVINADDYYGRDAFKKIYDYLCDNTDKDEYCMAGYYVENTLSEQGTVTRGVCETDGKGYLTKITETKNIGWKDNKFMEIEAIDEKSQTSKLIEKGTVVSMNFWGFKPSIMEHMITDMIEFLDCDVKNNPMKAEFLLPIEVGNLLNKGKVTVKVIEASDKWYGVKYKEDKDKVKTAFSIMKKEGKYPEKLWS